MNKNNLTPPLLQYVSSTIPLSRQKGILLGALVCSLIAEILCLPLWTDYDAVGFARTLLNKEARMDVIYTGTLTGAEAFSITSPELSLALPPGYSYGKGTQLCTAVLQIEEEWKPYSVTLNAHRKGSIDVRLKGPYRCNDYGETYSIATDYRHLKINGKEIFSDRKKVTYARDFSYRIPVNANETINISFAVRRHHLCADDFNLVITRNYWYIITLSILTFAISYNLLHRISVLSCRCRKPEDAFFLFVFFLLLVVPVSNISDAQKSIREGRTLKQRPKVSSVFKEGANFGKEYDDWFCDHLGGRDWLLKCHDEVQSAVQQTIRRSSAWLMQESGWSYRPSFATGLKMEFVSPIVSSLVKMKKFCDANHIKFYVFVVPRKEDIYQESLYGYGLDERKGHAAMAIHEQIRRLTEKQHVSYIFPWTELRNASKQDYIFFKLSQHWTDWGAYIGYRALMDEIREDFPNVPVVSLRDYMLSQSRLIRDEWDRSFSDGWLRKFFNLNIEQCRPTTMYNYYDHRKANQLVLNMGEFMKDYRYRGGVYKIMLIGDSQNENLLGFLPYSAATTRFIRVNRNANLPYSKQWKIMKYYKKEILSYKPDILILSLFEPNLLQIVF